MASYTANYGLHQWEAADDFLRTDFNTDHALIDGALAGIQGDVDGKTEVVTGSYTGTAEDRTTTAQDITLGFQPKLVVFGVADFRYNGAEGVDNDCMALYAGAEHEGTTGWAEGGGKITATGFQVFGRSNSIGTVYYYAALK